MQMRPSLISECMLDKQALCIMHHAAISHLAPQMQCKPGRAMQSSTDNPTKAAATAAAAAAAEEDSPASTGPQVPELIRDVAGLRVWHRGLGAIRLPKAAAYFSIAGWHMEESPLAVAGLHLLLKLVRDALCEDAYLADIAGLQYEVGGPAQQLERPSIRCRLLVLLACGTLFDPACRGFTVAVVGTSSTRVAAVAVLACR